MVTSPLMLRGRNRLSLDPRVASVARTSSTCELCDAQGKVLIAVSTEVGALVEQLIIGATELELIHAATNLGLRDAELLIGSTAAELSARGLLHRTLMNGNLHIAKFVQVSEHWTWLELCANPNKRYRLSRFAYFHAQDDEMRCESPTTHGYIALLDPASFHLTHRFIAPVEVAKLSASERDLANFLLSCGFLVVDGEEDKGPLKYWEFQDLLFHVRSRGDRTFNRGGGTYRFAGNEAPPPALSPRESSPRDILLRTFDSNVLFKSDAPFGVVQNRRRSQRKFGSVPLHIDQLAEFLFRVAKVRKYLTNVPVPTSAGSVSMDFALRPYPGGGALYESEIYVLINRLMQPEIRGIYKYDGVRDILSFCAELDQRVEKILFRSGWATGINAQSIQVLIIVSARFSRMQWKYETAAYAAMLKNAGVIIQTMYLVATTMGLACCANGQGESELFSNVIDSDYYAESSIGEMVLGSPVGDQHAHS